MGAVIFITALSLFHFFRQKKSEVFLLRISSGNTNTSAVATC